MTRVIIAKYGAPRLIATDCIYVKAPHPPILLRCATPDGPQPSSQRGERNNKLLRLNYGIMVPPHLIAND